MERRDEWKNHTFVVGGLIVDGVPVDPKSLPKAKPMEPLDAIERPTGSAATSKAIRDILDVLEHFGMVKPE